MMELFKVTREHDRQITDQAGNSVAVPGPVTDVRASPLAVFGLPLLLAVLALGTNALLESIKFDNAVQLACVNRAVQAASGPLPEFCGRPARRP